MAGTLRAPVLPTDPRTGRRWTPWLLASLSVGVAAVLGCLAILQGDADVVKSRGFLSALTLAVFSLHASACDRAWERRVGMPLPPLGVVLACAAAAVTLVTIWVPGEAQPDLRRPMFTSWALAAFPAHLCLVLAVPLAGRRRWLARGTGAVGAWLGALVLWAIWQEPPGEELQRWMGVLAVLLVAGTALCAILERTERCRST